MTAIKSGPKSLSDIALIQLQMRDYMLGLWLDGKNFSPAIKAKVREIFDTRGSYNSLWVHAPDTTWLFSWPKYGEKLIQTLEAILYCPSPSEETMIRRAVKDSNTPQEIVSWRPFCISLEEVMTEFSRSLECVDQEFKLLFMYWEFSSG